MGRRIAREDPRLLERPVAGMRTSMRLAANIRLPSPIPFVRPWVGQRSRYSPVNAVLVRAAAHSLRSPGWQ